MTRVIEAHPTDLKQYGLAPPRIEVDFEQQGDKAGSAPDARRQIADRRRALRSAGRRPARVPGLRLPGVDVQPDHVRPARQDAHQVRSRQGRRADRGRRRQDDRDREAGRGLDAREADPGTGGLRVRRGADRAPAVGADEVDCRQRRDAGGPEEVRVRQAVGGGHLRHRQRARVARPRRRGRQQQHLRPRFVAPDDHDGRERPADRSPRRAPTPIAGRTSSTSARTMRRTWS